MFRFGPRPPQSFQTEFRNRLNLNGIREFEPTLWLQALVAADSQLWDRAMLEASPTKRPSAAAAATVDERDDEWLLVVAEPRATNVLAVASVAHELMAGALFVPALEGAELLPSTSALRWAHKNWMSQVRRPMHALLYRNHQTCRATCRVGSMK